MSYSDDVKNLTEADLTKSRNEALATGSKYFWPKRPCLHGHTVPRFTKSDRCLQCFIDQQYKKSNRVSLDRKYGMTPKDWTALFEAQRGRCRICRSDFEGTGSVSTAPCVDHCHKTNIVRGLLCGNCNKMLGMAKDNVNTLKNAIKYLERANTLLG